MNGPFENGSGRKDRPVVVGLRGTGCAPFVDAISARLDGEPVPMDAGEIDEHLRNCRRCQRFASGASLLHRLVRIKELPAVPDLVPRILAAIGAVTDRRSERAVRRWRVVLALVAVVQLAVSIPVLILGIDPGAAMHTAHEAGSFELALAVGFFYAAWQPERSGGLVPLAAALALTLVGVTIYGLANGVSFTWDDADHCVAIVGLVPLLLLCRRARPRRREVLRS